MGVIIDEVTAEIQVPPPASTEATGVAERASAVDPIETVRLLEHLAERAGRLSAD